MHDSCRIVMFCLSYIRGGVHEGLDLHTRKTTWCSYGIVTMEKIQTKIAETLNLKYKETKNL